MSWFDGKSAEEEAIDRAHSQGQEDGSRDAGAIEQMMTYVRISVVDGDRAGEAYQAGVRNGEDNKPK